MKFTMTGKCVLTMKHEEGTDHSVHESTDFLLDVSGNLEQSHYLEKDGTPNKEGSKCLDNVFAHGLIGNIHYAIAQGWIKDPEAHLVKLFQQIRDGVANKAHVGPSLFPDEDVEFMQRILPDHYVCRATKNGVHCKSPNGISEKNKDEAFETMVMEPIRKHFGERFLEVFHQVCTAHLEFTVFLKK